MALLIMPSCARHKSFFSKKLYFFIPPDMFGISNNKKCSLIEQLRGLSK
ncbi:F/y rich C-terminus [Caudoviricetes sp.]|nr:F/y rich C-terminus [Caudoviricetes sp.]